MIVLRRLSLASEEDQPTVSLLLVFSLDSTESSLILLGFGEFFHKTSSLPPPPPHTQCPIFSTSSLHAPLSPRFPPPPSLPSFHHLSRRRRSSSPTARFLAQSSLLRGLFAAANSTSGCCCRPVGRDPEPGKALIATLDHGGRFPRRLSSPNARRRIVPLSTVCATCRASSLAPLDRCFLVVRHTDCRWAQTRGPKSWLGAAIPSS